MTSYKFEISHIKRREKEYEKEKKMKKYEGKRREEMGKRQGKRNRENRTRKMKNKPKRATVACFWKRQTKC